jgi:hypothetical protein
MLAQCSTDDLHHVAESLDDVGNFLFGKPLTWDDLQMVRMESTPERSLQYVLVLTNPHSNATEKSVSSDTPTLHRVSYSPAVDPFLYKIHHSNGTVSTYLSDETAFILPYLVHLYALLLQNRIERDRQGRFIPTVF